MLYFHVVYCTNAVLHNFLASETFRNFAIKNKYKAHYMYVKKNWTKQRKQSCWAKYSEKWTEKSGALKTRAPHVGANARL